MQSHSIPSTAAIEATRPTLSSSQKKPVVKRLKRLLEDEDAVLIAHYYTDADIQQLADESGGHVSDSLDMARFGKSHPAQTLIVAGVRFMGETAKILSPEKRVLMPTLDAECSLDLGCPAADFATFCADHPEHAVVVYANTSAAVKAQADWVATSSIALPLITHLKQQGKRIIWAPDRHLGHYLQQQSGADMLLWQGSCIVHEEFRAEALRKLREQHPDAAVLVHPEAAAEVIAQADVVGSTSQLIAAAATLPQRRFIVATDKGIFFKMRQHAPQREFLAAPTGGVGGSCKSCAHCPWMAMNHLSQLLQCLENPQAHTIAVAPDLAQQARRPIRRMLDFAAHISRNPLGSDTA